MLLNVQKNVDDVIAAFELMEGRNIAYGEGPYSVVNALRKYSKYLEHKKELPYVCDPETIAIIYGNGGIHRYFLKPNGTIVFSTFHMGWKDVSADAKSLGFIIQ